MYVDLLTRALDDWNSDLSEEALLDYVLSCRLDMLISIPRYEHDAYGALAAELAYDRSLIKLSATKGISADVAWFFRPNEERRRLEHALTDAGVDLTDLTRRQP